jgi:hypothetical protein
MIEDDEHERFKETILGKIPRWTPPETKTPKRKPTPKVRPQPKKEVKMKDELKPEKEGRSKRYQRQIAKLRAEVEDLQRLVDCFAELAGAAELAKQRRFADPIKLSELGMPRPQPTVH